MTRSSRRRVGQLVLTAAFALLVTACSHGSGHSTADASPTTTANTSTTVSRDAEVIAAWRRYWDVYIAVGGDVHMPDARLATVASGDELKALGASFLSAQASGQVLRGSIDLDPRVVTIASSESVLRDCYMSHIVVVDRTTGSPVGAQRGERTLVTATLVRQDGKWLVASIRHDGDGCSSAE